ncbi:MULTISPECIES: proline racemase family protein [Bacillus cereus group]|jgi:proline racemase|uniref:Proline racemase n=3 Tax=Bacillus cereus group TaxID=86661 RepID=A0A9W5R6Q5_BACCE|nr:MULTISPECIES: proline racemase family protein [Bacillus cereus group]MEB4843298.1 proline racemase family protein [Paenibacillus jamilae]HCX49005.1 proline racemase [Bacillus sp. (in: firmicutes)]ASI73160.1 proline racemase [Bacillus cereus]AVR32589.1 4-hydroxyproline epimerase [Bacillus cereus]EOQ12872.1 proline racemase [Bacillus cereus VD184]
MRSQRVFTTIDTHTGGNPTRTLISGLPKLIGETMAEKMLHMKKEYDWIRKLLMNEPRGHDVMSGALLTDPCHPEADIGVIYIETGGYLPMCGHDTIGVCTALVESGLIPVVEPITSLKLDTPAGLVEVDIAVQDGKAKEVSFCNIPAFLLKNITVQVKDIGTIEADIAYGGNFYAIIDAKSVGLELIPENASTIIDKAIHIRNTINEKFEIIHPEYSFIRGLTHVEFYTDATHECAHVKNTVVVPPGGIDRSPCGTGTSAKLAVLYAQKEIKIGEEFIHESIVGSLFKGYVVNTTHVENIEAVITKITGSAWLMGMHKFFYNEMDPLKEGFLLIPPMEHETEDIK